jgi:iron complex transport system substrate-binding protein
MKAGRGLLLTLLAMILAAPAWAASSRVRVASLLPYATEAMQTLPSRVQIVAAAEAGVGETLPAGAANLGNPHAPNFEILAAARPAVVIADRQLHALLREKLARGGATVVFIDGSTIKGTLDGLIAAAEAAGAGREMRVRVQSVRAELQALHLGKPFRVLPLFGTPGQVMAITRQTWIGDLLRMLGFQNLVADAIGSQTYPGYVQLSDEALSIMRPERVLLVTHGAPEEVEKSIRRKAVQGGVWGALAPRLSVLPIGLFARNPGLRVAEAARTLTALSTAADPAP